MKLVDINLPGIAAVAMLPLIMAMGCSGGGNGAGLTPDGGGGGGSGSNGDPGTDVGDEVLRIGRGFGSQFEPGQLDISVTQLSAGGSTTVAATLVNGSGDAFSEDLSVRFTSPCVANGLATVMSPIVSTDGRAQTTYTATGCEGDDTIRATAINNGTQVQASGVVNVVPAVIGSINFVSADPDVIGIRGTGGAGRQETSTVIFRVTDSSGGPVVGATVEFELSTDVGDIMLSAESATSNADGTVQTVVQAGSVQTTVSVIARTLGSSGQTISTQSDELIISTGVPDQDSFSLAASVLNPEAFNRDGVTSAITIRLADRFNNPVPDGTAVAFRTQGGRIEGGCTTADSSCTVTWTSQDPRPPGDVAVHSFNTADLANQNRGNPGRATILAFAIGEETFDDFNGSGDYDNGDGFTLEQNIGEAFRDDNETRFIVADRDDAFDQGVETFVDFNPDNTRGNTDGSPLQNSLLCDSDSVNNCDVDDDGRAVLLNVFSNLEIVMSGPAAQAFAAQSTALPDCNPERNVRNDPDPALTCTGGIVQVRLCDTNGNTLPATTAVQITGVDLEIVTGGSTTIGNSQSANGNVVSVAIAPAGDRDNGSLFVEAVTPGGVSSTFGFSVAGCGEDDDMAAAP